MYRSAGSVRLAQSFVWGATTEPSTALTRLPGQPPIKIHPERQSEADKVLGGLGMDFNAPSTTAIAPPSSSSSDSAEEALTPIVEKTLFQVIVRSKRRRIAEFSTLEG